ncbi:MAG: FtsX-like permease family protein, partial [Acidobacteria bacterium]
WILRVLPALIPPLPIEVNLDFRVDLRVGLATSAVALAATMLAGIAPAFTATRADLSSVLKAATPGAATSGRRRGGVRQVLVVAQLAVMFLLVEMAALFGLSLQNAARTDTGFAPGAMAFADLAPGAAGLNRAQAADAYQSLIDRVRALPNVDAAAYARHVPLNSIYGGGAAERVVIPGHVPPPGATAFDIRQNVVSPGFFSTIGTPLIRGRDFSTLDRADSALVTVINETMARKFWEGQEPIGRRLELLGASGTQDPSRQVVIVGIVADGKYNTLRETPPPYMFFPMSQVGSGEMTLIARGRGDERALASALRAEIIALNRNIPSLEILTRSEHFHRALFLERALAGSTIGIGSVSLGLAMVGMYGVMAFAVVRRRREIGIEMALGASRGHVVRSVIGSGARLALTGIAIGGSLGLGAAGLLGNAVYDISPLDPRVFLIAAAITLPLALIASAIPASRASRIDPVQSIRESVS